MKYPAASPVQSMHKGTWQQYQALTRSRVGLAHSPDPRHKAHHQSLGAVRSHILLDLFLPQSNVQSS